LRIVGSSSSCSTFSSIGRSSGVVDARRLLDHLADQPQVVLDHPHDQVHRRLLGVAGQAQAARWVEVHVVG
jgi:hypothetical protein